MRIVSNRLARLAERLFPKVSRGSAHSDKSPAPTLELRVPISPSDDNMRSLHYLLESIQAFGGPIARSAHCVASVGADEPPRDLKSEYTWTKKYSLDFHWIDRDDFRAWQYDATGFDRFRIESDADVVALIDADLIVGGDFDTIVVQAHENQQMLGSIAHVSPFGFEHLGDTSSEVWWNRIYRAAGLPDPCLEYQHTGWGLDWSTIYPRSKILVKDPAHRYCPPYFNYGIIIGPRAYMEKMGSTFVSDLEAVGRVLNSGYKSQIANCLAFERHCIPCAEISIKYNFALNIPGGEFCALNPDPEGGGGYSDIRIFHYIGGRAHFASKDAIRQLLANTDLDSAWLAFQSKLAIVHERIEGTMEDEYDCKFDVEKP